MNGIVIHNLDPIIKVLYHKHSLRSFLTQHGCTYTLYYKSVPSSWYSQRTITEAELEEIKELLKSPIEKIDLGQLEKF
jgi:hypothetical protein